MTAHQQRLKPIGFWSYARQDDEASDGRLSQLRGQLARELQQVYGRDPINLWQDVAAIPPGTEWEKAIDDAIAQSTYLIPIITPAFVESEFCCREVEKFLAREAEINAAHPELKGQRRIFPIFYIDVVENDPFDPDTVARLMKLQFVDFRQLREEDDPVQIRKAIVRLAGEIARLLKIKVTPPPTTEELEEQRRRQAERAHKEEQRKRAAEEAAKRKADEERLEAERIARERKEEAQRQQEAERLRLAERERQQEEQRAASAAAREVRQRAMHDRIGAAKSMLAVHRFKVLGALGLVGAVALAGAFSQTGDGAAPLDSQAEAAAADAMAAPAADAMAETPPPPALALTGTWALENVPCVRANAENGRQELAWSPDGGWKINGVSVKGEDTPNSWGWFEIDGLFWRVAGGKLQVNVEASDNYSSTSFNRCAG